MPPIVQECAKIEADLGSLIDDVYFDRLSKARLLFWLRTTLHRVDVLQDMICDQVGHPIESRTDPTFNAYLLPYEEEDCQPH